MDPDGPTRWADTVITYKRRVKRKLEQFGGIFFCNQCHILMWSDEDMRLHHGETKHQDFRISVNQEQTLVCVKCSESFSSLIESKDHMGKKDHTVFKCIDPPLQEYEEIDEEDACDSDEEFHPCEADAYQVDESEDEDEDEDKNFTNNEERGEADADSVSEGKDDEKDDPVYIPDVREGWNVKRKPKPIHQSDTDESEYLSQSSQQIMEPLPPGRTLKLMRVRSSDRRILRKMYVIAETTTTEVALKKVKRALEKFDSQKILFLRIPEPQFEPRLNQLCFLKTSDRSICGKQRRRRLRALLVILRDLLIKNVKGGTRENSLHYTYRNELNDQNLVERLLQKRISKDIRDITLFTRVPRESLGIIPADKGSIRGAVDLYVDEEVIDCLPGASIPGYASRISRIVNTAEIKFLLVVEKESIFHDLTKIDFHVSDKCILVTGKGYPDVATRILVRKLRDTFRDIPFYALVDGNPSGASIFFTYCTGSEAHSHDNLFLTVYNLKFIGVLVKEIETKLLTKLTDAEKKRVRKILSKGYLPQGADALRQNLLKMLIIGKGNIELRCKTSEELVNYIRCHTLKDPLEGQAHASPCNLLEVESYARDPLISKNRETNCRSSGLENLGNTCYMNTSVQCLAHTQILFEYFSGHYEDDIHQTNNQAQEEIVKAFVKLVKLLRRRDQKSVRPLELKQKIGQLYPVFSGGNQEDSHELLLCLLDGIHTGLNKAAAPYRQNDDSTGRPDEEVADEYWSNHLAVNKSIISDTFYGQYKSTLKCLTCGTTSVTFTPLMGLSLPIPSKAMSVTVFGTDGKMEPFSYDVAVPPHFQTLSHLIQPLSSHCKLGDDEALLITVVYQNQTNDTIIQHLESSYSVQLLNDGDKLVAYRLPKESKKSPLVIFTHYFDKHSADDQTKEFGAPLLAPLPQMFTGMILQTIYLRLLKPFRISKSTSSSNTEDEVTQGTCQFEFYLINESGVQSKINMDDPNLIETRSNHLHVRVRWLQNPSEQLYNSLLKNLPEIQKLELIRESKDPAVSLQECLEAHLEVELKERNCPSCNKNQRGTKKLDLWRLPEVLIVHFNRFSTSGSLAKKETLVEFPIRDLDLLPYVANKNGHSNQKYQLYAISNHYGTLNCGHYTSYISQEGNGWSEFDDAKVAPISENKIVTNAAYVLFYRRQREDSDQFS